ncbi:MAG: choice-of-anchor D domain-containing protein [Calditrichia bacterium]
MNIWLRLIAIFIAGLTISAIAQPGIATTPDTLKFAEVLVGEDSLSSVTITNSGDSALVINGIVMNSVEGNFALANPLTFPLTIAPDSTSPPVSVRFAPLSPGAKAASLRIFSNIAGADSLKIVQLRGTGIVPDLQPSSDSLSFAEVVMNSSVTEIITLENIGGAPLQIDSVRLAVGGAADFSLVSPPVLPQTLLTGQSINVTVQFSPQFRGFQSSALEIVSNDADSPLTTVPVTGTGIAPQITVSPTLLNFGNVLVDHDSLMTLHMINTGNTTLTIDDAGVVGTNANRFNLVNPPVFPKAVPAGDTLTVTLRFAPNIERNYVATLVILSDDPAQPSLQVPLSGRGVHSQIEVSATNLNFGDVQVKVLKTLDFAIYNTGEGDLIIDDLSILSDPDSLFKILNFPPRPHNIHPGDTLTFQLGFRPDTAGVQSAALAITNNDPDPQDRLLLINLSGNGVNPVLVANPENLEFGSVPVSEELERTFYLKNNGTALLIINTIELTIGDTANFDIVTLPTLPAQLQPGSDSAGVTIRFRPQTDGLKTATVTVTSNDSLQNPFFYALSGTGVAPNINSDPASIAYGGVRVGQTFSDTLDIFNEGQAPLVITNIILQGAQVDQFEIVQLPSFPLTIQPDKDTLKLAIAFSPTSTGQKAAEVRITNNSPNENPYIVPLSGSGTEPQISASADSLGFGTVRLGSAPVQFFNIVNTGTAILTISDTNLVGDDNTQFNLILNQDIPIKMLPNADTLQIGVRFAPNTLGEKNATLELISDDPNRSLLSIALNGIGALPEIGSAIDTLAFGAVVVSESTVDTVFLQNNGGVPLTINGLAITGTQSLNFGFTAPPPLPRVVLPGGVYPLSISFAPDAEIDFQATLVVLSDDPNHPNFEVPMTGLGVLPRLLLPADTLDFDFAAVNRQNLVEFVMENSGGAPLIIDSLGITGLNAGDFQVVDATTFPDTIAPNGGMLTKMLSAQSATTGNKTARLIVYSNSATGRTTGVFMKAKVVNPPTFSALSVSDVVYQTAATVTATVQADTTIRSVTGVAYSADQSVNETLTFTANGGSYEAVIPASAVTLAGLTIVTMVDDDYQLTTTDTVFSAVRVPAGAIVHNFPETTQNRWQMFSLPMQPINESDRAISAVLADFGAESDDNWRIYRTDSTGFSINYYDRAALDAMGDYGQFEPGNAFWIYLRNDAQGSVASTSPDFPESRVLPTEPYNYTLQPGWNQVGNPFTVPVNWSQVSADLKDSLAVYAWDNGWGSLAKKSGWTPQIQQDFAMAPFNGYAIFNPTGAAMTLTFDPLAATESNRLPKELAANEWQLQLIAEGERTFDVNVIGMRNDALPTRDALDFRNPTPVASDFVSLQFHRPEWQSRYQNFCSDFRPVDAEGQIWYFDLRSSNRVSDFFVNGVESLPAGFQLQLIDRKYNNIIELTSESIVRLRDLDASENNRFALLAGTPAFIEAQSGAIEMIQPESYALLSNYPNPFNPETYIRYRLSAPGNVELAIFNILGQQVVTLVDREQPAGFYEIRWDGRNSFGQETASGVYIYRLKVNDFVDSFKMIKLK